MSDLSFEGFWPGWPGGDGSTLALVDTTSDVDGLFRLLFASSSPFQVCTPLPVHVPLHMYRCMDADSMLQHVQLLAPPSMQNCTWVLSTAPYMQLTLTQALSIL